MSLEISHRRGFQTAKFLGAFRQPSFRPATIPRMSRASPPSTTDLAIDDLSRLARPIRGPGSSRRGESFNFSRQVITQMR